MSGTLFETSRPSPLRIGAGSAVIAAHVAAFLLMSLSASGEFEPTVKLPPRAIDLVEVITRIPVPPVPPPPMPVAPPRVQTTVVPRPPVLPVPAVPVESDFVIDVAAPADVDVQAHASTDSVQDEANASSAGNVASLALLHAPEPPYPARAKRLGLQGEVLLRIHVGADGLPREVRIVRSSGHVELDRSARSHILRHWRFVPLQREAMGEVPIRFALL